MQETESMRENLQFFKTNGSNCGGKDIGDSQHYFFESVLILEGRICQCAEKTGYRCSCLESPILPFTLSKRKECFFYCFIKTLFRKSLAFPLFIPVRVNQFLGFTGGCSC